MIFTRTCGLPDIELAGANGAQVNPSDFAGHELLVVFCPANLPDASVELAEYNSLADALAFHDAYMIAVCDPEAGSPASRVTIATDPQGLGWKSLAACLSPEEQGHPGNGAAFLLGRGGCLKESWYGSGHAEDVRRSLGARM